MIEYFQFLGQEVYKILFLLIPILVSVAMIVWLDRRVWGLVQKRKGPNVVGPFGLFQTLADALKYIFKEIIIPASANKTVFIFEGHYTTRPQFQKILDKNFILLAKRDNLINRKIERVAEYRDKREVEKYFDLIKEFSLKVFPFSVGLLSLKL